MARDVGGPGIEEFDFTLTLAQVCRCCAVPAEKILLLVGEGILAPRGSAPSHWRFAADDLGRALRALRLERDLGVNPPGAALAIELVDEMDRLRRRVRLLEALLDSDQPNSTRGP